LNSKDLEESYQKNKDKFHHYINTIKENMKVDIYSVINTTLISNPYATAFPKNFFLKKNIKKNQFFSYIKKSFRFYIEQFYFLCSYLISFILYKIFYKKKHIVNKNSIGIDLFFVVDNIIKDNKFNENYFKNLYEVLDKYNQAYIFIPRLYGVSKNPFKLIKLFKILNQDKRDFLFEFELLNLKDFISLFGIIFLYPFKTLRLRQDGNKSHDKLFNQELINDISKQQFEAFSRYIYGQNIASTKSVNKIYSWSEFQVVERSFNYGIRNNGNIHLIACQFYLNYETYFNAYIDDIDYDMLSSAHEVLVNGKYYVLDRRKVLYRAGAALRYQNIFTYSHRQSVQNNNILLLGSYIQKDTQSMLKSVEKFERVFFKNHPVVNINVYGQLKSNIRVVNDNIYELFKGVSVAIGTASGTSVEAVSCGVSVIIIASADNLTANPLVAYGKGKIWDIAFTKDDVEIVYNKLIKYRIENQNEMNEISFWYRDNFFVEPTEENIVKAFELEEKE